MSQLLTTRPRQDGFHMPAEFEPHDGCWILWPHRADSWRDDSLPAQQAFAAVAKVIVEVEPVRVAVSAAQYDQARGLLDPRIELVRMASDDAWMRDIGPTFVVNDAGQRRGIDWIFNAWGGHDGGLNDAWDKDDAVAAQVLAYEGEDRYRAPLVLEGGAIHVDGEGTLITTEECLLNPNRNPHLQRDEIEALLRDYLGVDRILWLKHGCYNDETDGHVDNLCCFVRPGEVLLSWTDDHDDPQYPLSKAAYDTLSNAIDARGRRLKVHRIHQPRPILISSEEADGVVQDASIARNAGDRLAGSYVNYYHANGRIIFPLLDPDYDEAAQNQLQALYPEREIVGVPAREILLGGGNIHCITQQIPAKRFK